MDSKILSEVRTVDELVELTQALEELERAVYKTKKEFDNKLGSISESFANTISSEAGDDPAEYIKTLKSQLEKIDPVKLTIAFEPTKDDVDSFFSVCGKVMDITVDQNIIAGATISSGGEYRDYSARKVLKEICGPQET